MTSKDPAFEMTAANLRYGPGVTREAGMDLQELGSQRVLVVTDSRVAKLPPVQTVCESLAKEGLEYSVFDRVRVEPNEASLREAVAFAALAVSMLTDSRWEILWLRTGPPSARRFGAFLRALTARPQWCVQAAGSGPAISRFIRSKALRMEME